MVTVPRPPWQSAGASSLLMFNLSGERISGGYPTTHITSHLDILAVALCVSTSECDSKRLLYILSRYTSRPHLDYRNRVSERS